MKNNAMPCLLAHCRADFRNARLILFAFALAAGLAYSSIVRAVDLTITVEGVRSSKGTVVLELDNSESQWDNKASPVATGKVSALEGRVVYVFHDLNPDRYAVGVFHDENDNGQLDTNFLGIPKESWGYSNDPKGLRKARFDEASFQVSTENRTITIHLVRAR